MDTKEIRLSRRMGSVFVLSAPSGTGKSTLAKRLVAAIPDLIFSVSVTTRAPRAGEVPGHDYVFVDHAQFDQMVKENQFLEWAQIYENRYGTSKIWVEAQRAQGQDVLLDIDPQGALNIHRLIPDAVMIFLMPPSANALAGRLKGRGDTSPAQIAIRLGSARKEMEAYAHYDYLVINDTLEAALTNLEAIVLASRLRRPCMQSDAEAIIHTFA